MSVQLLDKTRKINKLLHNNNSSKVVFTDICEVLTEILASNVLVVSKKGKVLGVSTCEGVPEIHELLQDEVGEHIDPMLNERLLSILSTKENVNLQTLGFTADVSQGYQAIITPINIAGERLGTLFLYRKHKEPISVFLTLLFFYSFLLKNHSCLLPLSPINQSLLYTKTCLKNHSRNLHALMNLLSAYTKICLSASSQQKPRIA